MSKIPYEESGTGRNRDYTALPESQWYRCSRCGYVCNKSRDMSASAGSRLGWGHKHKTTTLSDGITVDSTEATVDSTSGFPSSGDVLLHDGNKSGSFDYSGKTDTTFTGLTNITASFDAGTNVIREGGYGCPLCGNLMYDKEEA